MQGIPVLFKRWHRLTGICFIKTEEGNKIDSFLKAFNFTITNALYANYFLIYILKILRALMTREDFEVRSIGLNGLKLQETSSSPSKRIHICCWVMRWGSFPQKFTKPNFNGDWYLSLDNFRIYFRMTCFEPLQMIFAAHQHTIHLTIILFPIFDQLIHGLPCLSMSLFYYF